VSLRFVSKSDHFENDLSVLVKLRELDFRGSDRLTASVILKLPNLDSLTLDQAAVGGSWQARSPFREELTGKGAFSSPSGMALGRLTSLGLVDFKRPLDGVVPYF